MAEIVDNVETVDYRDTDDRAKPDVDKKVTSGWDNLTCPWFCNCLTLLGVAICTKLAPWIIEFELEKYKSHPVCISGYLIGIGGVALGGGIWTIGGAGEWRWTSPDGDGHELDIRPEVFDTRPEVVYIGGITDWSGVEWFW